MAILREFAVIPDAASPFETTISARTPVSFTVTGPNSLAHWTGTGMTYDAGGKPNGGFLTGLSWELSGHLAMTITNAHANIALFASAGTEDVLFAAADTFYGHNGADRVGLRGGNDTYFGFGGNDYLDDSGNSSDRLYGGAGNDTLLGGAGVLDVLDGGAGKDILRGEQGNDVLRGGVGTDRLYGGAGADKFQFVSVFDSLNGAARDVIYDFSHAQHDKIDLSAIDANGSAPGAGTFTFVGSDTFGGTRAELRFAGGILSGDLNGDRIADFSIHVITATALVAGDIIL